MSQTNHANGDNTRIATLKEELLGEQKEYMLSLFLLQAAEPSETLLKQLGNLLQV